MKSDTEYFETVCESLTVDSLVLWLRQGSGLLIRGVCCSCMEIRKKDGFHKCLRAGCCLPWRWL